MLADLANSAIFSRINNASHVSPMLRRNTSACNDADSKKMVESSPFSVKGQRGSPVLFLSNNDLGRGLRLLHENGKGLACLGIGDGVFYDSSFKLGQSVEVKGLLTSPSARAHDTFSIGRLLLSMFCRKPEDWESEECQEWENEACNAAKEGKAGILRLMMSGFKRGVALQQQLAADRFADLIAQTLAEIPKRISMNKVVTHPANTRYILSPEHEAALKGVQGIPMTGGPVKSLKGNVRNFPCEKIRESILPPVSFVIEEGKGISVKIHERVSLHALISLYAGAYSHTMAKSPPSRYTVSVGGCQFRHFRDKSITKFNCDAGPSPKLTFEWFLKNCVCGPFMNAARSECNCRLGRAEAWVDNEGIVWMPMFATRDIEAGEFLWWSYDPTAGEGLKFNFS